MPVTDYTDPLPPTITVGATDRDTCWQASPWPASWRTKLATYDLTGLTLERSSIKVAPVKLRRAYQPAGTVLRGGTIRHRPVDASGMPRVPTWAEWHANYGAQSDVDRTTIIGTRFTSLGDGISATGADLRVVGCWFDEIHDDAIQLDAKRPALVDSCVLDGVHIAFSAESYRAPVEHDPVLRITNTMVRLRGQHESYAPERYGPGQHGPFFKWDPDSPTPDVRDSIFRADTPSSYGRTLSLPIGSTGSNVVLVGWETWTDEEIASWSDQVDGLVLGTAEHWDNALAFRTG